MAAILQLRDPPSLAERIRNVRSVTRPLMLDIIARSCRRLPSLEQGARATCLTRLIEAEAWTDAALALIEIELPLWQVRRIAYDSGEWFCALSRQREMPDWLDSAVEGRHSDLPLAVLSAFAEAQTLAAAATRPSVPSVRLTHDPLFEPVGCDNFG